VSATASWRALGTTATVVVTDPAMLDAAREAVVAELAAIDLACSRFRDDSELAAVNAGAGRFVRVSPLFAQALAVALRAARMTGGAVDPTLGAELRRAGYDRDFAELAPADADAGAPTPVAHLDDARRRLRGGWRAVELDAAAGLVRIPKGMELDLGATAKALAADRAARAAHHRAVGRGGVLVSLGGDVSVAGPAPQDGWAVRVQEDHAGAADAPGQTVAIATGGLATSGTTVRRWRAHGERRHHILDPRSGRPAAVVWRTATVAAATCVDANAASTAAIVRGAQAPTWLLRCGLPARLVGFDGRVIHIGAWPRDLPAGTPPVAEVVG
jgi:FAD:protein FMN transferase